MKISKQLMPMLLLGLCLLTAWLPPSAAAAGGTSLRFFGSGPDDIDRVKIPLGPLNDGWISGSYPVNVAGDFTIAFWMRAAATENSAPDCAANGWYYGNIIIDRDVDGPGDYGDYGVALCDGRIAFGVSAGEDDRLALGATSVTDDQWHHIAVTRADGGLLAIYVDGRLDGQAEGPSGPIDYRADRPTEQPDSDPYLVLGAEKHDYEGSFYYNGFLDDLHISATVRYTSDFAPPTAPHAPDAATVALYRFDEGAGVIVGDSSGAPNGPSDGTLMIGGTEGGPLWSSETPFTAAAPTEVPPTEAPTAEPTIVLDPTPPTETSPPETPSAEPTIALEPTPPVEPAPTDAPSAAPTDAPIGSLATLTPNTEQATATPPNQTNEPTFTPEVSAVSIDTTAPPPTGSFAPLSWALAVVGAGLLLSLTTVLLWRRRV
jgi:hypothetical protein